jgi:hypothetical protein
MAEKRMTKRMYGVTLKLRKSREDLKKEFALFIVRQNNNGCSDDTRQTYEELLDGGWVTGIVNVCDRDC